jgi:hypothetical protein
LCVSVCDEVGAWGVFNLSALVPPPGVLSLIHTAAH